MPSIIPGYILTLLLLITLKSHSQNFIPVDTLTYIPEELISIIKEEIETVYRVDYTGNGKADYLVESKEKIEVQELSEASRLR